ncbi:MAG: hydantoinase/oxoprolinase [Phycisphaerales bacterium]|nr:hydantoinase/oxoprolinase [Phycisphaerales bacterium]
MSPACSVRIGIDVGGTFTHAVALDAATRALMGKAKVPTTHSAAEGVARGVVDSLLRLLGDCGLRPDQVLLIAHSTTQATNALLEGDVASVGIVGVAAGPSALLARRQTAIRSIPLAPGRYLRTTHRFLRAEQLSDAAIDTALDQLTDAGAVAIVAAAAFSVDDPAIEEHICARAQARGLPVTATHHVSRLHGLGIRTRTAVINASMIPRMLATANMTEQAVRAAGIQAPVMIMRSDGGVMDIAEMRRRPILTMLSGPAAGVAAALLYAGISDGVFLEVGGTSTDISAIKNGRCRIRSAEIGGQKLHVSTLDVRTVGVAGGSLVYLRDGQIAQVGPRSAHIAGLQYLSFADCPPAALSAAPFEFEGERFLTASAAGEPLAVTPTCASNLLGLVPAEDPARGRSATIAAGFEQLATVVQPAADARTLAARILDLAARAVARIVEGFARDYKLDRSIIRLIGGGGGASAIVPYVAQDLGLPSELVRDADVISAIGVALALVRDSVERTVIEPGEEDIRRIREEAFQSVLRMGAAPDTIEVFVEVDSKRNLLRATAEGSTEIRRHAQDDRVRDTAERAALVTASLPPGPPPECAATAGGFEVWTAPRSVARLWRLLREKRLAVRVLDRRGSIRWASNHADLRTATVATAERELTTLAERYTRYSDAGATIPRCFVLVGGRIIDLSGLCELRQVLEVLRLDLQRYPGQDTCLLLVDR